MRLKCRPLRGPALISFFCGFAFLRTKSGASRSYLLTPASIDALRRRSYGQFGECNVHSTGLVGISAVHGQICEVIVLFLRPLALGCATVGDQAAFSPILGHRHLPETLRIALSCLPCDRCRLMEKQASNLVRVRLGKQERHVLMTSARPVRDCAGLTQNGGVQGEVEETSRAFAESLRRAIRKLTRVGLLWSEYRRVSVQVQDCREAIPDTRIYYRLACRLSPLGQAVVDQLRADLKFGRRVRWAKHQAGLVAAARRKPLQLLAELRNNLERTMDWVLVSFDYEALVSGEDSGGRKKAELVANILRAIKAAERSQIA
jgi:hypothetical protein